MSIRGAVYDFLKATETDVYAMAAPQELDDPYVAYSIRREAVRSQDGFSEEVFVTLNIYANVHDDCVDLAETLASAYDGGSGTYDSETLHICNWISEGDGYIPDLDKFVITQEYQLRFI